VPIDLFQVDHFSGSVGSWSWIVCGDAVAAPHFFSGSGVNIGLSMAKAATILCLSLQQAADFGTFNSSVLTLSDMLEKAKPFC
jgi:2-polyprenyl-6-methoxyphenol hydroxylase-like FAD-dependent oxidoreductase